MTERGLLFNDAMVRAILDGTKTQTRRPVKVQLPDGFDPGRVSLDWLHPSTPGKTKSYGFWINDRAACVSPFGGPSDHIWVRECFAPYDTDKLDTARVVYRASYDPMATGTAADQGATRQFTVPHHVAMEWSHAIGLAEVEGERWQPSIHMPRWASRIRLLVKRVWIEWLQDITEEDAIAEGVPPAKWEGQMSGDGAVRQVLVDLEGYTTDKFHKLWDSIYAAKGYGFDTNPLVWGCEFERVDD